MIIFANMQLQANVAGGLVNASATVADVYVGIFLLFVGAGVFATGLAMLSSNPSE